MENFFVNRHYDLGDLEKVAKNRWEDKVLGDVECHYKGWEIVIDKNGRVALRILYWHHYDSLTKSFIVEL